MFFKDVYEAVKEIPEGRVATYGAIAEYLNSPGSSLVVGWALHANKEDSGIPCHRVVNKKGIKYWVGLRKYFWDPSDMLKNSQISFHI